MNNNKALAAICISFFVTLPPCLAEVITDGTVGQQQNLAGPHFQIGQDLGTLRGHNLFHSFSHFNVDKGQSATFTGSNTIQNVVSRVTGGEASNINGTLKSDIGHAAFYFINPAGIVFGKNAQVDVPGAFYASTAGQLQFADGAKFSALHPRGNTLSMAVPEAFGFLGKQTGTITFNGSGPGTLIKPAEEDTTELAHKRYDKSLLFTPGSTVQLTASHININNTRIASQNNKLPGLDLQLAAVGNAKQIIGVKQLPNQALQGNINIKNTTLDASGDGKARLVMRANNIKVNNSLIYTINNGITNMPKNQGLNVQGTNFILTNTTVKSEALNKGNAGSVTLNVKDSLKLIGSKISTDTRKKGGYGNAGSIQIKAGSVGVISSGSGLVEGKKDDDAGESYITASVRNGSIGNGSSVDISAKQLLLYSNSKGAKPGKENRINASISSDNQGSGHSGAIHINADTIKIDHGVIGATSYDGSKKDSGTVNIKTRDLTVSNHGGISTGTFVEDGLTKPKPQGNAGTVNIHAQNIVLLSKGYIDSVANNEDRPHGFGNAGTVNITATNNLIMRNGAEIGTSSGGEGNAGKINVNAGTIQIYGNGSTDSASYTGIRSDAYNRIAKAQGGTGIIDITAKKYLSIKDFGKISTSSGLFSINHTGLQSKITINSPVINLNNSQISTSSSGRANTGLISINKVSQLNLTNSQITTQANKGSGSSIVINAKDWVKLHNGQITTSVADKNGKNAGSITIKSDVLVMDTGFIQANTAAAAKGGEINLQGVKNLIVSNENLQKGENNRAKFVSNSGINVVQAVAPSGVNGNVTVNPPKLNIVGNLISLNIPQPDLSRLGQDPCSSTVQKSTIKKQGKGGVPLFNKSQDGYTIDRLLNKTASKQAQPKQPSPTSLTQQDCQHKHNSSQYVTISQTR